MRSSSTTQSGSMTEGWRREKDWSKTLRDVKRCRLGWMSRSRPAQGATSWPPSSHPTTAWLSIVREPQCAPWCIDPVDACTGETSQRTTDVASSPPSPRSEYHRHRRARSPRRGGGRNRDGPEASGTGEAEMPGASPASVVSAERGTRLDRIARSGRCCTSCPCDNAKAGSRHAAGSRLHFLAPLRGRLIVSIPNARTQ